MRVCSTLDYILLSGMICAGFAFLGITYYSLLTKISPKDFLNNAYRYKKPIALAVSVWGLALFFMVALLVHTKGSCQWSGTAAQLGYSRIAMARFSLTSVNGSRLSNYAAAALPSAFTSVV
jgi:hypothetical protein